MTEFVCQRERVRIEMKANIRLAEARKSFEGSNIPAERLEQMMQVLKEAFIEEEATFDRIQRHREEMLTPYFSSK